MAFGRTYPGELHHNPRHERVVCRCDRHGDCRRAAVVKQYPGRGMEFTLTDRVAGFFPAPK
jgi:hypothetical protein